MNKKIGVALFLSLSLSALGAMNLQSGELSYRNDTFLTKEGKQISGEYEIKTKDGESLFVFKDGKLIEFEYDGRGKDDLEIEGRFVEKNKYFQGEISIEEKQRLENGKKETKEISLEGKIAGTKVFDFAKELINNEKAHRPSFSEIENWKLEDGKKEIETKNSVRISKSEKKGSYSSYQVQKMEKREIYSQGKLISNSSSSSSSLESREEKF